MKLYTNIFLLLGLLTLSVYGQNVGIGTPTPASKLSVSGNLSVGAGYVGTAAPTNGAIIEGWVGIGTTTPDEWMVIGANHDIVFHNGGTDAIGFSTDWVSGSGWVKDPAANFHGRIHHDPVNGSLYFLTTANSPTTNADIRMFINSTTGNVGIGTISPTQRLHVAGNFRLDNAFMPGNNAGAAGQVLVSAGPGAAPTWKNVAGSGASIASICASPGTNYVQKWTGTELCNSVIYDDGTNVGIGTNNPTAAVGMVGGLTVNGTNATVFVLSRNNNPAFAVNISQFVSGDVHFFDRVGGAWNRFLTGRSGRVGIGTTNPTQRLHVAGNFRLDNAFMPGNNAGNSGEILVSRGAGNAPVWESVWKLRTVETWTSTTNANGWTGAGVTNCGGQILLGGYNTCGSGCTLTKTFTGLPPHSEIMVKVYWWAIDTWDHQSPSSGAGLDRIRLRIDGNIVSYGLPTFPQVRNNTNRASNGSMCGLAAYADGGPIPLVGKINHTAGSVTVQVDCLVNEASNNESCGIQMVEIWMK